MELINRHTQLKKGDFTFGGTFPFFGVQNLGKKKPIVYFIVDFSFLFFFFSFSGSEPSIRWNVETGLNFSLFSCNNCLTEMKVRQFLDFVSFQFLTIALGVIDRCSIVVSKAACQKLSFR